MTPPFPSPRPSPLGRGRIIPASVEIPATGFARAASENQKAFDCCSLSPRERVRVRGKSARFFVPRSIATAIRHNIFFISLASSLLITGPATAGQYTNFSVAVYIPVNVVRNLGNPETLHAEWERIHSQLKIDKVYLEVQRD